MYNFLLDQEQNGVTSWGWRYANYQANIRVYRGIADKLPGAVGSQVDLDEIVNDDAVICPHCGVWTWDKTTVCEECGHDRDPFAYICPDCGGDIRYGSHGVRVDVDCYVCGNTRYLSATSDFF